MTAQALHDTNDASTSARGCMYPSSAEANLVAVVVPITLRKSVTANTYAKGSISDGETLAWFGSRTAAGPAGEIERLPMESTAEAILEIRRLSGLTWQEVADLFAVSRRSVHHWANGKTVAAKHDRTIRRMLAALRHLYRGDQIGTRAIILSVDQATQVSAFDLLKHGRFDEAISRVEGVRVPAPGRIPLSRAAQQARRPPAPTHFLEAEQDRPDIPAKARVARPKRTS